MQAEELRALQAPLKQRYREQPQAAVITLSAQGSLDAGIACAVATGTFGNKRGHRTQEY